MTSIVYATWREINLLARSFLDQQQGRVGTELRMQRFIQRGLLDAGLYVEVKRTTEKGARGIKIKPVKPLKDIEEDIRKTNEMTKSHPAYIILRDHWKRQKQHEKELLNQSIDLVRNVNPGLVEFCKNVKGLGEVAVMTFSGFINPLKIREDGTEVTSTVSEIWSSAGLTPAGRLKHGEQSKFNPHTKGRFWLCARNVIRSMDPYYKPLYDIKKAYFQERPDLLFQKQLKPKGWPARMNGKSIQMLSKLLVAHAHEAITSQPNYRNHKSPVPMKPVEATSWSEIQREYLLFHAQYLERLKPLWQGKETMENPDAPYWTLLIHGRSM